MALLVGLLLLGEVQAQPPLGLGVFSTVGVGLTNPAASLHIQQTDGANPSLRITNTSGTLRMVAGDTTATNDGTLGLYNVVGTLSAFLRGQGSSFLAGGNVGIGVAAPARLLHVQEASTGGTSTSNTRLLVEGTAGTASAIEVLTQNTDVAQLLLGDVANPGGGAVEYLNAGGGGVLRLSTTLTGGDVQLRTGLGNIIALQAFETGNVAVGNPAGSAARPLTIHDVMNLVPRATAPTSPAAGDLYVDSTPAADELCFYDGSAWQGISSGTDANCA